MEINRDAKLNESMSKDIIGKSKDIISTGEK